jgi:hypothetical protein
LSRMEAVYGPSEILIAEQRFTSPYPLDLLRPRRLRQKFVS